ncbi:LysR family transcriptional regulator [Catenulispora sp. GP43]|uniref:LysR family transcriptional regulator n=1 Tax=Catenulispora sp. GP43 TaxID=3156263 RepID=UPI0035110D62
MLNTRRLSLLRDIDRTGTIAGAAQLAGCTPSAASQQISALEQELGINLLERYSRSVRLTEAGRVLVEHAHRVFAELDAAETAVRAVSGLRGGGNPGRSVQQRCHRSCRPRLDGLPAAVQGRAHDVHRGGT